MWRDIWCHSRHAGPGSHGIQSDWRDSDTLCEVKGAIKWCSPGPGLAITADVTDTGIGCIIRGQLTPRLCENYDFALSDQSGDDDISECVNMILLLILLSQVSAQSRPPKFKTLFYPQSPSSKPSGGGGYSGSSPSPTPAYSPPKSPSAGSPRPHNTGWSHRRVQGVIR